MCLPPSAFSPDQDQRPHLSEQIYEQVTAELVAHGRPERAEGERAYLKSSYEHLGVGVPATRAIVTDAYRNQPITHDDLIDLVHRLWETSVYEQRLAAVLFLTRGASTVDMTDLALVEHMIRTSNTWALVDPLSIDVVSAIIDSTTVTAADRTLDVWAADSDFWIRRAALLSSLRTVRRADGDPARFFRYAEQMITEKEFFIRKAIGWVLRDMSRKRPDLVFAWLLPHASAASTVTVREAVKYLTPEQRRTVLDARQ
jgi:3-methyladenine DNA glycosylase AlkD